MSTFKLSQTFASIMHLNSVHTVKKYAALAYLLFSQCVHMLIFIMLFPKRGLSSHVQTSFSSVLDFQCSYTV